MKRARDGRQESAQRNHLPDVARDLHPGAFSTGSAQGSVPQAAPYRHTSVRRQFGSRGWIFGPSHQSVPGQLSHKGGIHLQQRHSPGNGVSKPETFMARSALGLDFRLRGNDDVIFVGMTLECPDVSHRNSGIFSPIGFCPFFSPVQPASASCKRRNSYGAISTGTWRERWQCGPAAGWTQEADCASSMKAGYVFVSLGCDRYVRA